MCIKRKKNEKEKIFIPENISIQEEVVLLRNQVKKLDGFREGTMSILRWISLIITILGVAGIFQFTNSLIEKTVGKSVDHKVNTVAGNLSVQLANVEDAVSRADNAVGRAESAANSAADSLDEAKDFVSSVYATATAITVDENTGDWTVIISSDVTLQQARYEVSRASNASYSSTIYKIGDYYATTIGKYKTKEEAQNAMIPIRAELNDQAYPLDMAESCPYPRYYEIEDFYVCFYTPQAAGE